MGLVRRPKEEGGLGFESEVSKNISLVRKWMWRFSLELDSLWHRVIKSKFGNLRNRWMLWLILIFPILVLGSSSPRYLLNSFLGQFPMVNGDMVWF